LGLHGSVPAAQLGELADGILAGVSLPFQFGDLEL
jgi:hypothetical protein